MARFLSSRVWVPGSPVVPPTLTPWEPPWTTRSTRRLRASSSSWPRRKGVGRGGMEPRNMLGSFRLPGCGGRPPGATGDLDKNAEKFVFSYKTPRPRIP